MSERYDVLYEVQSIVYLWYEGMGRKSQRRKKRVKCDVNPMSISIYQYHLVKPCWVKQHFELNLFTEINVEERDMKLLAVGYLSYLCQPCQF